MSTLGADKPRPPRPPMVECPHCQTKNEPHRTTCRNCHQSLNETRDGRICRTAEEAFHAGWQDGEQDPPLTEQQILRLAALLGRHIRPAVQDAA